MNIQDRDFIRCAVLECFKEPKKRRRGDTRALFARVLRVSQAAAHRILMERDAPYFEAVERIADIIQCKLKARKLDLPPVRQRIRRDPGSGKLRKISILSIQQLLFDHVAVLGLTELAKRIGEYQVSSIKDRGDSYGRAAIKRWLRGKNCKYATKLDIRDFYGSIKRDILLRWMVKRVKNRRLLWLVNQLINTVPRGIAIGSYLSQTLANIYLSDLYHLAMERCLSKRVLTR